jgi:hypothetical protein
MILVFFFCEVNPHIIIALNRNLTAEASRTQRSHLLSVLCVSAVNLDLEEAHIDPKAPTIGIRKLENSNLILTVV